jgi:hypothetical protein
MEKSSISVTLRMEMNQSQILPIVLASVPIMLTGRIGILINNSRLGALTGRVGRDRTWAECPHRRFALSHGYAFRRHARISKLTHYRIPVSGL